MARYMDSTRTVLTILKFTSIVHCIGTYGGEITMTVGPSMLPTFNELGDIVIAEKLSVRQHNLKRGDVIIAKSMTNPRQSVCKRIVGMAGDTMRVAADSRHDYERLVKIPEGHIWIEGDNPQNSTDSRYYGPVPINMVKSKVILKIWPVTEMTVVGGPRVECQTSHKGS